MPVFSTFSDCLEESSAEEKGEEEPCGGCGRSNYGEKPHTAQGMNEAQRNLGEEIHLNQFEKFIWANSRNLS